MRKSILLIALAAALCSLHAAEPNQLTADEKKEGWVLLFNGKDTTGWRRFNQDKAPEKWVVEDGTLKLPAGAKGGDIVTADRYEQFDLQWEWKIAPRANNGLKYFILEERKQAIGHEYQMIDDSTVKEPKYRTAGFYEVLAPNPNAKIKSAGEWNTSRIIVKGQNVQHWLNGEKALEYTLGSDEVKKGVAASKFKAVAGFGERQKGHILLTDHNDEVAYRNIKIRDLSK